ncbi:MAG: TlpA disulfide reductase family protein [Rikenellaceae bacterium]
MKNLIFSLIILLCSCSDNHFTPQEKPTEIVIIFKDAPDQSSAKRHGTSILPRTTLNYVDANLQLRRHNPKLIGYDTLVIPSHNGHAEVMHRNQGFENNYYLLLSGDTVLFTYGENLRPQIKSLRSDENTWLYNTPQHDNRAIYQPTGYSLETYCTYQYFVNAWNTLHSPKYQNDKSKREYAKQKLLEFPNIDSLRVIYDEYKPQYAKYIDSLESSGRISPIYANFFRGEQKDLDEVLHNDSLLRYPSSHALLAGVLIQKTADEVTAFSRDTTISKYARLSALEFKLQSAQELSWGTDPKVIAKCAQLYEELLGSSFYTTEEPSVKITADAKSMILEDLNGEQLTFDQLLEQNRGKAIYVDLWASWCPPCIAGMKAAETLRQEFSDKNVLFVYLALRDKIEPWKAAIEKHHIDTYDAQNYFIVNPDECTYLKEVDNRAIPQFILYNPQGELTNHKAPSASSDEIREILRGFN